MYHYISYDFQEKFKPNILHQAAVFLNPKQRTMKVVAENKRAETLEYIRNLVAKAPETDDELPAKRVRHDHDFEDELDDDVEGMRVTTDEITTYQSMTLGLINKGIYSVFG